MNAPINLQAISVSGNEVKLIWDLNSNDHIGVRIMRTEDVTWKEFCQIHWSSNINLTSFTDKNIELGRTYYYKVNVYDWNQQSPLSNGITAVIPGELRPNAPSNLIAIAQSSSNILLTWIDNSENEEGFVIERQKYGDNFWSEIASVGVNITEYLDISLLPSTTYLYRVYAFNNSGLSDFNTTTESTS